MRFSRRGAKDNRARLVWSKYFNYKLEGKDYYFKQKAYATYCDGWTEYETITKQTYRNAIKRRNECIEIIVEEDVMGAPLKGLSLIFSEEYGITETDAIEVILTAKEAIEKIKENCKTNKSTEYKIFRKILKLHIDMDKEDVAI